MKKRNIWRFLSALAVCLFLAAACERQDSSRENSPLTLWVVTEKSTTDGMNYQAESIAQEMESQWEGLTVELEILPTEEPERSIRLKQLRTQIMAGNGPDVYLLPTGSSLKLDDSDGVRSLSVEPLFPDVTQAMYDGVFRDIQSDYEADETLGKEALNQAVMDAGCLLGARYVLPLRFDLPLVVTAETSSLTEEIQTGGLAALVRAALEEREPLAAYALELPRDLRLLPQALDYQAGRVLLTEQELADYMELYQAWNALAVEQGEAIYERMEGMIQDLAIYEYAPSWYDALLDSLNPSSFHDLRLYISYGADWLDFGFPFSVGHLGDAMDIAAIGKAQGISLKMMPLPCVDGHIAASVTYYGAVGVSSRHPELAYEFLRQFLLEPFQWETYRPRADKDKTGAQPLQPDPQSDGLVEQSWPVRVIGSVSPLWDNRRYQVAELGNRGIFTDASTKRERIIKGQDFLLTDADIPLLTWPLDEVRFPIYLEGSRSLENMLGLLNEPDGTPTDAQIDKLSQQVWQGLWWHLAEG